MNTTILYFSLLILFLIFFFVFTRKNFKNKLPPNIGELLQQYIPYYQKLSDQQKLIFIEKVKEFLGYVRIEGVGVPIDWTHKFMVASAAIIPVLYFKYWKYDNLRTVLIYPGSFNREEFLSEDFDKDTLGMVGNGPMQRMMILSISALQHGFREGEKSNTAIHEFIHLLDKEDGDVDGLPQALLNRKNNAVFQSLVTSTMNEIYQGHSDIDAYALVNKAEFFAVTASYFFNCNKLFLQNHPALYALYAEMFEWPAD